ncbi:MAG: DUF2059 domain-containing protein [Pyrinomonadaceae bacterium]|nr:DUF2059 domain-containing protein [Acidobacteriota bacterium]MBP7376232.1 DUF2059 domain-containing protein [Pyrinomonadaceae bacterium]
MSIRLLPLFFVLIITCASASAQPSISAEKRQLIGEMVLIFKMDTLMEQMTDETLKSMESTFPIGYSQAIDSNPSLTTTQKAELKRGQAATFARISSKFRERIKTAIDFKKYIDEAIYPLYDKFYSEQELKDLIQFYKSPTGQKVIETMPQLFADSQAIAEKLLLPQILPMITEIVEEEFKALPRLASKRGKEK